MKKKALPVQLMTSLTGSHTPLVEHVYILESPSYPGTQCAQKNKKEIRTTQKFERKTKMISVRIIYYFNYFFFHNFFRYKM